MQPLSTLSAEITVPYSFLLQSTIF